MTSLGPDLVIAGAARSGTSTLAAALREHPAIDPGATKEPNYFSRHLDRGEGWYDGLFLPRADGLLRMDASTSYTYPDYPAALDAVAAASPQAQVVYIVREPVARAVSHYLLRRFTLKIEPAATFGAALAADPYYTDVSDYRRWIGAIDERFGTERSLVVPFAAVTASSHDVSAAICARLGIEPPPRADGAVQAHRNTVVEFRGSAARRAATTLRRSSVYPKIRSALGATRVRRLRSLLITAPELPTVTQALATCSTEQRADLDRFRADVQSWVGSRLQAQDAGTGLDWAGFWPES